MIDTTNPDARAEVPTLRLVNGERVTLSGHCYVWSGRFRAYTILTPAEGHGVHIVLTMTDDGPREVGAFWNMPDAVTAAQWDDAHS